jgi:acyl transferase domain-containing protein
MLDTSLNAIDVHVRASGSDNSWDRHAHGFVRRAGGRTPASIDVQQIQRRCPDQLDRDEFYCLFAASGIDYGPSFRGIARLWRGEREALAEICVPSDLCEQIADYRLHPAVLDACLQPTLATVPASFLSEAKGEIFVPAKIERVRFYAALPRHLFSYVLLTDWNPTELRLEIQIIDREGEPLADIQGLICRPLGRPAQPSNGAALYEYQWTATTPRRVIDRARCARRLPSVETLAPLLEETGHNLWQRFNRGRFQKEFQSRSHATALAYILRALRELGWTPATPAATPAVCDQLGVAPQHRRLLQLFLRELNANEIASIGDPQHLWKSLWDDFSECYTELLLLRRCGAKLAAVLKGEIDPLNLVFPEGSMTIAEHYYQNSETFRVSNLLMQKAVAEMVNSLPKGNALRMLEIGGGTGGVTSFVLPVLPEHCTEYIFTDVSLRFIAHAQQKLAQYSFVQYRPLDIELDPVTQGFGANSFDVIIAADVLHATQDLRKTLERVKSLLAPGGTLMLLEATRPWLHATLIFGLLKGWWLFEDYDLRPDGPCLSGQKWKDLLRQTGFSATVCVADCPVFDSAQQAVILARGPQLPVVPAIAPLDSTGPKAWLIFADAGVAGRASAGAKLVLQLRQRGDRIIQVIYDEHYRQIDESIYSIRVDQIDDMRRMLESVSKQVPRLAGIVHLWSLDIETSETMSSDMLISSARLGCVGVVQLVQAIVATHGLVVDSLWLITRSAQPIENRAEMLQVMQSPLWGLGRVAINEYQNLHCRLVDLTTCAEEEIALLVGELNAGERSEDEIALHGELRYVHRLMPVSPGTVHGMGRQKVVASQPFRIELQRPGFVDSLTARHLVRTPPKPHEIEIEVTATALNFKDLMLTMGMLPKDAIAEEPFNLIMGFECAGRVVAVGGAISEFAVGDEVVSAAGTFASHITVDA